MRIRNMWNINFDKATFKLLIIFCCFSGNLNCIDAKIKSLDKQQKIICSLKAALSKSIFPHISNAHYCKISPRSYKWS